MQIESFIFTLSRHNFLRKEWKKVEFKIKMWNQDTQAL